jgi:hypothetical protein
MRIVKTRAYNDGQIKLIHKPLFTGELCHCGWEIMIGKQFMF